MTNSTIYANTNAMKEDTNADNNLKRPATANLNTVLVNAFWAKIQTYYTTNNQDCNNSHDQRTKRNAKIRILIQNKGRIIAYSGNHKANSITTKTALMFFTRAAITYAARWIHVRSPFKKVFNKTAYNTVRTIDLKSTATVWAIY